MKKKSPLYSTMIALTLVLVMFSIDLCLLYAENITESSENTILTNKNLYKEKNNFESFLSSFSSEVIILQKEIEEGKQTLSTFQNSIKIAREKNIEFDKVYLKWNNVQKQHDKVIEKLKSLSICAGDYFNTTRTYANTIHDKNSRESMLKELQTIEDDYIIRLKTTKKKIDEVSIMKIKVDDTMKVIEIKQSITVIEEQIKTVFAEIDKMISDLTNELNALDIDSRKLLNSMNSDNTSQNR